MVIIISLNSSLRCDKSLVKSNAAHDSSREIVRLVSLCYDFNGAILVLHVMKLTLNLLKLSVFHKNTMVAYPRGDASAKPSTALPSLGEC